jgi:hypothetical protein
MRPFSDLELRRNLYFGWFCVLVANIFFLWGSYIIIAENLNLDFVFWPYLFVFMLIDTYCFKLLVDYTSS